MTIIKRGSGYGVRVYDPATKGKRWVGTFATKRDALKAVRDASQAAPGRALVNEDAASYASRWL